MSYLKEALRSAKQAGHTPTAKFYGLNRSSANRLLIDGLPLANEVWSDVVGSKVVVAHLPHLPSPAKRKVELCNVGSYEVTYLPELSTPHTGEYTVTDQRVTTTPNGDYLMVTTLTRSTEIPQQETDQGLTDGNVRHSSKDNKGSATPCAKVDGSPCPLSATVCLMECSKVVST